jgi:hypothetical protein
MKDKPEESGDDPRLLPDELFDVIEVRRPSHCPQCGDESVKRIFYGLPTEEDPTPVEERDYVLGGFDPRLDSPSWHCGDCGHKW